MPKTRKRKVNDDDEYADKADKTEKAKSKSFKDSSSISEKSDESEESLDRKRKVKSKVKPQEEKKTKGKKKKSEVEEVVPKIILGVKRGNDCMLEYAVEMSSSSKDEKPSIMICSSAYLTENCPELLISYLEQHVVMRDEDSDS